MLRMAEFWVAVSFVVFLLILVYYKIPALIAKALDDRAEAIRKELDEARRLREEAQNLLDDYQKKHRNARPGGRGHRRAGAPRGGGLRAGDPRRPEGTLERRTRQAEDKIARAEAQAVDEVRAAAVDAALAAAERILREKAAGAGGAALIDQSIRDLKGRLN